MAGVGPVKSKGERVVDYKKIQAIQRWNLALNRSSTRQEVNYADNVSPIKVQDLAKNASIF
ncbi:unnamed protein product [marine sediment metagenome]|uniref:Uncharacterized protein n=1 Tax=marine sediment metagenome TaxID=412755 RepID=X1I1N2_9ZZZZ